MRGGNVLRLGRYMALRAVTQGLAVVVALYLTVLVVNMGGKLDDIRRSETRNACATKVAQENPGVPPSVINQLTEQCVELECR